MALPIVLFGAFDRHNFGDLLLGQIAAAMLPGRKLEFAGLAERDLRGYGGFSVRALPRLLAGRPPRSLHLMHVGGEILTCEAWTAAAMLLDPADAKATIAYLESRPAERADRVRRMLGFDAALPYLVSRRRWPALSRVVVNAAGGVALDRLEASAGAELCADLQTANAVSVRDRATRALLAARGVSASLVPDPAVMTARLFGDRIADRARAGALARIHRALPGGYLAVQFGAEFSADATLDALATQLGQAAGSAGCGIVLFRAGAAPWHDDLPSLHRLAGRLGGVGGVGVEVFGSLDLWDIAALIAGAKAYCGSSLHGRIVAIAFAVPRVGLALPGTAGTIGKQAAFAATWDDTMPAAVEIGALAGQIGHAIAADRRALGESAARLAERYEREFAAVRGLFD